MNKLIALILVFTIFSCDKMDSIFSKDNEKKEETIDFTQVDQFPQFSNCTKMLSFNESKSCFEETVRQKLSATILALQLQTNKQITDTLLVKFSIDKKGDFLCNKIRVSDSLQLLFPNIIKEVTTIIHHFKAIAPAQKRGIPVTSAYTIPIVINIK